MVELLEGFLPKPIFPLDIYETSPFDDVLRIPKPSSAGAQKPTVVVDESDDETIVGDDDVRMTDFECLGGYHIDDCMADEDFVRYIGQISRTTAAPAEQARAQKTAISEYSASGKIYKRGKAVELQDGSFLRIKDVLRDNRDDIWFQGSHFQRQDKMGALFPHRLNELCLVENLEVDESGGETVLQTEIPFTDVKGLRIIRLTNNPYESVNASADRNFSSEWERYHEGQLYCRTKHITKWKTVGRRKLVIEEAVIFLTEQEADPGFRSDAEAIRLLWRGPTKLGGSYTGYAGTDVIDLSQQRQQYTFGDGFCGAGGVSRGALLAGLRVTWGFDKWDKAMESYRMNFDTALGETCEVADFLTNRASDIIVDIMHLSPPCQTFSPAHTIAAASDDANEACIFAVRHLLEKVKPRIATMEETSGLKERHEEFLHATVHTFVELGYSVRWGVLHCKDYGVPQHRKRLLVVASGPGETLPSFPRPTHGPADSDLLPYRTIQDAIRNVPLNAPDHDLDRAYNRFTPKPPLPANELAKTITCNGGENYHPSGLRAYTWREAACLQTFPLEHRFCGVGTLKQIGNAVPPVMAKAVFREIIKELERTDGIRGRARS